MNLKTIRSLFVMSVCAVFIAAVTQSVSAGAITYTETGTITGTIGSTAFTNAAATITTVGDTANVSQSILGGGIAVVNMNAGTTTIDIAGVGTATFSGNSFGLFSETVFGTTHYVGIADLTNLVAILFNPDTSLYDGVSNVAVHCAQRKESQEIVPTGGEELVR